MAFFKLKTLKAVVFLINMMTSLSTAKIPDDRKPINIHHDTFDYPVFQGLAPYEDLVEMDDEPKLSSLQGLLRIGRNFYVYSRDHIFVLNAECQACHVNRSIPYKQIIQWKSSTYHTSLCISKGQLAKDCKNFIKIFEEESDSDDPSRRQVVACGTNSFDPTCKIFKLTNEGKLLDTNQSLGGNLMCPCGPRESIATLTADGSLYTATVSGFGRGDALVLRSPRSSSLMRLRTKRSEKAMLNDPNFVRFVDGGNALNKVFVFLTEWAIEDDFKAIYTRVGQVCKNDEGGAKLLRNEFSSFFKARLNCSLPGQPPFYFNELRDVTDLFILDPWYGYGNKKMVFAVMNTPTNSVPASAVCVFALDDIDQAMNGPFLEKYTRPESDRVYWEKLTNSPQPHLARCDNNPRELNHENLNFVRKHPLMHDSVPAWDLKKDTLGRSGPIFTRTNPRNFLTTITVDTNAGLRAIYTVLFVGTEDGKILKILLLEDGEIVLVEERMIFNSQRCGNTTSRAVKKILLDEASGDMMVAFESCIVRAPLCPMTYTDCEQECVRSRDPYCAWNETNCVMVDQEYVNSNNTRENDKSQMLQDVTEGNTEGMTECSPKGKGVDSKDFPTEMTTVISNSTSLSNASQSVLVAFPLDKVELKSAQISSVYLIILGIACILFGFICGCGLLLFLRKKRMFSWKNKYDQPSTITTTCTYNESDKPPNDRRNSNQSMKSRQRHTSTSSQHNNHQGRISSNASEQKRKRTETESSHGNRSDDEVKYTRSNSNGDHVESPADDVSDAKRRNQQLSTSSSVNEKKQSKNSKNSMSTSNEYVETVQPSPLKQHPPFTPSDSRQAIRKEDHFNPQGLYINSGNGMNGHPNPQEIYVNQVNSPINRQVGRVAPNRSISFKEQPKHSTMQPRAYGTGNRGAKGVSRQMSLQMPNTMQPVYVVPSQGYYSPQVKPSGWQPHLPEEILSTPNNTDHRNMADMIHSLDRRRRKGQNYPTAQPELLEGIQQMPPPNGQPIRKRYASESEKLLRHPMSRAPPYQAIHEEQGPRLAHPVQDARAMRQNLTLTLPSNSNPVENRKQQMINPKVAALGRAMSSSQSSSSNPGTPSREIPPSFGEFTPSFYPQAHMHPHQNEASEHVFLPDGIDKISPTRSNPSTPMHDGRLLSFTDDRRRHFSGQNHLAQQPPSPTKTVNPLFQNHQNPPSHSKRNRNHSGGNNRGQMVPVNTFPVDDYVPVTTSNGQSMMVNAPLIPPT